MYIINRRLHFIYNKLLTLLSVVSAVMKVSARASSRDRQDIPSQQLQQGDTVETFRQKYLSSGKFSFNVIYVIEACLRAE